MFLLGQGDGAWGDTATADAQCRDLADSLGVAYRETVAFRSDPGDGTRYIRNFKTTFKFSGTSMLYAGYTDTQLGPWDDAIRFFPGGSIYITLIDAGLMPYNPVTFYNKWYSGGSGSFVDPSNTCNSWTDNTNSFYATIGRGAETSISWINDQNDACDNFFWRYCLV